jgi:hypothetical protein
LGEIGLNGVQRKDNVFAFKDQVKLAVFRASDKLEKKDFVCLFFILCLFRYFLSDIAVNVDIVENVEKPINIEHDAIVAAWREAFMGHFFAVGQVSKRRNPFCFF